MRTFLCNSILACLLTTSMFSQMGRSAEEVAGSGVATEFADKAPAGPLTVRHGTFRKHLILTGQLAAGQSTYISVPRDSRLQSFAVTDLVPEGTFVERDDFIVRFDSTDLAQRALELEKQKEDIRIQIAQRKAEQDARLQDLRLALATAQKNLNVADLYISIDRSLIAASEADRYEFDYSRAKVELEKAKDRLNGHAAASAAELAVTELELQSAQIDLERLQLELDSMTIFAPNPGLVIHGLNLEGRKIEVGDSLFRGNQVAVLPDMSSAKIRATSFDRDFALLRPGDKARVIFDAYSDRSFSGSVLALPEAAKPKDRNSELNLFTIEIALDEVDLSIMRPGMTARVEIPIDTEDSIIVPRRSLLLKADGTSHVVPLMNAGQAVEIEVLDSNAFELSVKGNLADGLELVDQQALQSPESQQSVEWIAVNREDLKFTVSATGVLKASRSVAITPPPIRNTWRFRIISATPEGRSVNAGDPLVAFDASEQRQRLQQEQANLGKAEKEIEKVRATQVLAERDLELELEDARVQLERATNKLGQAKQFESGRSIQEAEQEHLLADARVKLLTRKLESTREHSRLQIKILDETVNLHKNRIQILNESIESLQVVAPQDGVVIYRRDWNNQKKQVGSDTRMSEVIMTLPDLTSLVVEGQVAEVDSGKVKLGQVVEISLDAMPGQTLFGRVARIGKIFVQPTRDRPLRVLNIEAHFDEVDPEEMRPEMVSRLSIVVDHYRSVLSLPLSVIQGQGERSFVWVERESKVFQQEIELGENNGVVAVVVDGLQEGDKVATGNPNDSGVRQ